MAPESLLMHRVANAVTGGTKPDAETPAGATQKKVIVRVLKVLLDQIVIHILDRNLGTDSIQTHCFQLEHHQGAGGVLGQGLVNVNADFLAG